MPDSAEEDITQPLLEHDSALSSSQACAWSVQCPVDHGCWVSWASAESAEGPHPAERRQPSAQPLQGNTISRPGGYDEEAAQGPVASGNPADDSYLQALPRATSKWRGQRALMAAWLLSSIATFLPSIFFPFLWTLGGMAGFVGSCWYFCHYCGLKAARDIAANVQVGSMPP